ncbi:hypothetical protein CUN19_11405 [Enterococcus faecium]|uniref:YqaJ viral recombinase family protein n=1 Tax=Enterococcus faecium TaxID=1352 RepID=UPI000CF2E645|nr:YqaJ viral recombinase family protein [Enterococcus faecium]PQB86270.1 hypothetical protein CUN19_11405 [Enterococcus faecium]PQF88247.1 hypothetical protein CUS30_10110 [Enterococcus faecium]RBT04708.1 hypothetical protein EA84_01144 [Enterococcus faecium]
MFKLLKKSSVIRESLVEVINKSGETKKEIARQINVSQQSLSDWTTVLNTKPVTLENAQALTDHFRDSDFTLQVIHEFFGLFKSIDGDVYRKDPSSLNKWKSPYQLWLEKTGQVVLEESGSEPAYWGNVLEEVVAKEFQERTGKKVRRRNQVFEHPLHPFLRANIDRDVVGENVYHEWCVNCCNIKSWAR